MWPSVLWFMVYAFYAIFKKFCLTPKIINIFYFFILSLNFFFWNSFFFVQWYKIIIYFYLFMSLGKSVISAPFMNNPSLHYWSVVAALCNISEFHIWIGFFVCVCFLFWFIGLFVYPYPYYTVLTILTFQ